MLRPILIIVGVLALLMGLLWMGQGAGLVRWPASSFMIDMRVWTMRGAILALAGIATILIAGRIR